MALDELVEINEGMLIDMVVEVEVEVVVVVEVLVVKELF